MARTLTPTEPEQFLAQPRGGRRAGPRSLDRRLLLVGRS